MENEKNIDAVRMMREIRDQLSREFAGMTFEEQQKFIRENLRTGRGEKAHKPHDHAA